jgi:uncharacterized protein (DUF952 family)
MNNDFPNFVFKLATAGQWRAAVACETFNGSPDDLRDGYIHLSAAHQVEATARKYFSGVSDLVLVAFRTADLGQALRFEASRGGEDFPHLYEPLRTACALWVHEISLDRAGIPLVPPQLLSQPAAAAGTVQNGDAPHSQPRTDERQQ